MVREAFPAPTRRLPDAFALQKKSEKVVPREPSFGDGFLAAFGRMMFKKEMMISSCPGSCAWKDLIRITQILGRDTYTWNQQRGSFGNPGLAWLHPVGSRPYDRSFRSRSRGDEHDHFLTFLNGSFRSSLPGKMKFSCNFFLHPVFKDYESH